MVGRYFMKQQRELGIGLDKFRDEILVSIKVKSQETTLGISFKPTQNKTLKQ